MSVFRSIVGRAKPCLLTGMAKTLVSGTPTRVLTRNLVLASCSGRNPRGLCNTSSSKLCSCGCGIHGMHTRGDRELVEFLQEEIVAERKSLVSSAVPSHVDEFAVSATKAEIKLTRSFHDEDITITMNVNHTVDTDAPVELSGEQPDTGELKSRPSFEVDIKVGSKTLSFTCSFTGPQEAAEGGEQEDVFGINEVTMYEGEWSEEVYCVSGDILDGMMYDLMMNMLEERGITNDLAEQISTLCSNYEHSLYVSLLQNVQDFIKRK